MMTQEEAMNEIRKKMKELSWEKSRIEDKLMKLRDQMEGLKS